MFMLKLIDYAKSCATGSKGEKRKRGINESEDEERNTRLKSGHDPRNFKINAFYMKQFLTKKKKYIPSGPFDNIKLTIQLLMDEMDQSYDEASIDSFFEKGIKSENALLCGRPKFVAKQVEKYLNKFSSLVLKRSSQTCSWMRFLGTKAEPGIYFLVFYVEPFEGEPLYSEEIDVATHKGMYLQTALYNTDKRLLIPVSGKGGGLIIGTNIQKKVDARGPEIADCLNKSAKEGLYPAGGSQNRRLRLGGVYQVHVKLEDQSFEVGEKQSGCL